LLKEKPMSEPRSQPDSCPRCNSPLRDDYDEPKCWVCGWADYSVSKTVKSNGILSKGATFYLRYVGDYPLLKDRLITATFRKIGKTAKPELKHGIYTVNTPRAECLIPDTCPFCEGVMLRASLSGKDAHKGAMRFICGNGHRIYLVPHKDFFGWH